MSPPQPVWVSVRAEAFYSERCWQAFGRSPAPNLEHNESDDLLCQRRGGRARPLTPGRRWVHATHCDDRDGIVLFVAVFVCLFCCCVFAFSWRLWWKRPQLVFLPRSVDLTGVRPPPITSDCWGCFVTTLDVIRWDFIHRSIYLISWCMSSRRGRVESGNGFAWFDAAPRIEVCDIPFMLGNDLN